MSKYECVSIQGNLKHVADFMNEPANKGYSLVAIDQYEKHIDVLLVKTNACNNSEKRKIKRGCPACHGSGWVSTGETA